MKINSKENDILNNTSSLDVDHGTIKQNKNDLTSNTNKNIDVNEPINRSYLQILNPTNIVSTIARIVISVFNFFENIFIYIFPNSSFSVRSEISRLKKAKEVQVRIANELLQRQKEVIEMSDLSTLAIEQTLEANRAVQKEKFLQEKRMSYLVKLFNIQDNKSHNKNSNIVSVNKEKISKSILDYVNISSESKKIEKISSDENLKLKDKSFKNTKNNIEVIENSSGIVRNSRSTNPEVIALRKDLIRWMDRNEKLKFDLDEFEQNIIETNQKLRRISERIDLDRAEIKENYAILKRFEFIKI